MDESHVPVPSLKLPEQGTGKPAKRDKSLLIALIFSTLFLLAAVAVCAWLILKPAGNNVVTVQPQGDGSDKVSQVNFLPGANLGANYVRRGQATLANNTTYYFDAGTNCGITTVVQPLAQANTNPKDAITTLLKSNTNTAITNSTDGQAQQFKDADGAHAWSFNTLQVAQNISIPGLNFNTQQQVVAYKQFGTQVASIQYSCPTGQWNAKKAELQTMTNSFTIKTQKG